MRAAQKVVFAMSLFGDLPSARNPGQPGSSAEAPFVPQAKSILKKTSFAPPSILRSKKRKADDDVSGKSELNTSSAHGLFAAFGPIEDEYDPAVPNEYDKAKQAQQDAVLEAEREARRAAQDRGTVRLLDPIYLPQFYLSIAWMLCDLVNAQDTWTAPSSGDAADLDRHAKPGGANGLEGPASGLGSFIGAGGSGGQRMSRPTNDI